MWIILPPLVGDGWFCLSDVTEYIAIIRIARNSFTDKLSVVSRVYFFKAGFPFFFALIISEYNIHRAQSALQLPHIHPTTHTHTLPHQWFSLHLVSLGKACGQSGHDQQTLGSVHDITDLPSEQQPSFKCLICVLFSYAWLWANNFNKLTTILKFNRWHPCSCFTSCLGQRELGVTAIARYFDLMSPLINVWGSWWKAAQWCSG